MMSEGIKGSRVQCGFQVATIARRGKLCTAAIVSIIAIATASAAPGDQYTFYVAPTGNGTTCTEQSPCSLFAAQAKARTVNSTMSGNITIYLRGGTYRLTQTFALTASDSGNNGYKINYAAYPGEKPILSGGQPVNGWQLFDAAKQIYRAYVGTTLESRQLYVNGVRAQRARGSYNPPGFSFNSSYGFDTVGTNLHNFSRPTDLEVVGLVEWKVLRCGVASATSNRLTLDQPCWTYALRHPVKLDRVSWLENAYEFIDEDGEWYLDHPSGYIYYKPRSGENIGSADATISILETLVSGQGTVDNPIHDIKFTGLTFSHNGWLRPSTTEGYPSLQAGFLYFNQADEAVDGYKTPAAVTFTAAHGVNFERNIFTHLGSAGLNFEFGSQNNIIAGNIFNDISSTAIQVGHINEPHPTDTRRILKNNSITNNNISDAAAEFFDSVGIFGAYNENILIEHNDISNLPYSGISLGWGWGKPDIGGSQGYNTPTPANSNKIQFNLISDTMRMLRDGGAVYTLGAQSSSTINNNYIDQASNDEGGIYLDEATQYFDAYNNVVAANPRWLYIWTPTIKNNIVRNNFADSSRLRNDGTNITLSNNQQNINIWPAEALTIMTNAGIQSTYRDIRTAPQTNIALNRPVIASSEYSGDYAAWRATDGNINSSWSPTGADVRPWLQVDLGSAKIFKRVEFVARKETDQAVTRRDFEVRASNDPSFGTSVVVGSQGSESFLHTGIWGGGGSGAAAYRYVRIAKTTNDYIVVSELRVMASEQMSVPIPTNVARNKVIVSSTTFSDYYSAPRAVDGDIDSGWSPTGNDLYSFIEVDLGQQYALSSVNVITRQDIDQANTRRNFEIWASNDADMSISHVVLGGVGNDGVPYRGAVNANVTGQPRYRYVALVKTAREYFFVSELEVFGTP
jgi:hypothetical protein